MSKVNVTRVAGVGWLAVLMVALGIGSVGAQTVQNGSFEAPALSTGSVVNGVAPDLWQVENPASLDLYNTGTGWWGPIPDGSQAVLMLWVDPPANPALVWQNLGATMVTGRTYTLSVMHRAGYSPGQTGGAQTLYMYVYAAADNTSKGDPVATAVYQHGGSTFPFQLYSLSFTCDAANNGKFMSIGLGGGRNHTIIDSVRVTVPVTLTGTVVPGDFTGSRQDVGVRIEVIQNGITVDTQRVFLDASGAFSISTNVTLGDCTVAVKANPWLRKARTVTLNGDTNVGTFNLTNGDADADNMVTSTDLSIFLSNMQ